MSSVNPNKPWPLNGTSTNLELQWFRPTYGFGSGNFWPTTPLKSFILMVSAERFEVLSGKRM